MKPDVELPLAEIRYSLDDVELAIFVKTDSGLDKVNVSMYKIKASARQDGKDYTTVLLKDVKTLMNWRYSSAEIFCPTQEDAELWNKRLANIRKEFEEENKPERVAPQGK